MPPTYKQLYFRLLSAASQACDALDAGDVPAARRLLIDAMRTGEEAHLDQDILRDQ